MCTLPPAFLGLELSTALSGLIFSCYEKCLICSSDFAFVSSHIDLRNQELLFSKIGQTSFGLHVIPNIGVIHALTLIQGVYAKHY